MTNIGVTGHRFLNDTKKLIKGVDSALEMIEKKFEAPYIFYSSLAEGADRLVAQRAFLRWEDVSLIVPLPLPIEDYMKDFESLVSKAEFLNLLDLAEHIYVVAPEKPRDQAYAAAGEFILEVADVLVAIWDGEEPQGEGGTGYVVAKSREQLLPLVWIHAGNRIPGTNISLSKGEMQGTVTLENFL